MMKTISKELIDKVKDEFQGEVSVDTTLGIHHKTHLVSFNMPDGDVLTLIAKNKYELLHFLWTDTEHPSTQLVLNDEEAVYDYMKKMYGGEV